MREILFMGKRKDNGEWVYWNMYGEICRLNGKRARIANSKNSGEHYYYYVYQIKQLIIPETIGQYTGLTDKNCKKIFEGDIIITNKFETPERKYVVAYDTEIATYIGESKNGCARYFTTFSGDADAFEVIGNIHDTPELLNEMESESKC